MRSYMMAFENVLTNNGRKLCQLVDHIKGSDVMFPKKTWLNLSVVMSLEVKKTAWNTCA